MPDSFVWTDFFAYVHFGLKILLILVAVLLALSGLDDSILDLSHHLRRAYRRFIVMRRYRPMSLADLAQVPERKTAILVPAWHEEAIIEAMLQHLLRSLDYAAFTVFVGIYPNDPATAEKVGAVARNNPKVRVVTTPAPGPTSKGDCLNAIVDAVFRDEGETQEPYEIFVLHDAEDVVHPLELRLFAKLIPRKDMVQLPVVPLEASPLALTAGHYMDEFAEHHSKDMSIREALTGGVPSAGVGCAFSRKAILALRDANGGPTFQNRSMTEDYAAAMQLQTLGLPLIFVRFHTPVVRPGTGPLGGRRWQPKGELVGTREYFPATLSAAVRQKARWLTGIVFQGWMEFGWRGSLGTRYAFFRDRKALATAQVSLLANFLVVAILALYLGKRAGLIADTYPPLVREGSWLFLLLIVNLVFLINRTLHRAYYVYQLYGPVQALVSPLRLVWSNYINFLACNLALWQVMRSLVTGRPVGWAKTTHRYPSATELAPFQKHLGDLLLETELAKPQDIAKALETQRRRALPLGQILINAGVVTEDQVLRLVARQHGLEYRPNPIIAPETQPLPHHLAQDLRVVSLGGSQEEQVVGSNRLLGTADIARLTEALASEVRPVLVPGAWIEGQLQEDLEGTVP